MQNKHYIGMIGGLGDVIYDYKMSGLERFKSNNPNTYIKAVVVSHNPQAIEIPRLNPLIDEIEYHPPMREMRDKKWTHKQVIEQYTNGYKKIPKDETQKTPIHLFQKENDFIKKILSRGPKDRKIAVIHPFASDPNRSNINIKLLNDIMSKLQYNKYEPIVIGGSWTQSFGPQEKYIKEEKIGITGYNLYITNLVGKTNARVAASLVARADLFIGCWSAFAITAWLNSTKSITVIPEELQNGCNKIHNGKYPMHHKDDKITPISNLSSILGAI